MEFRKICAMLRMKSMKRHMPDRMEPQNQEKKLNARGKGNQQILGNIGSCKHETSRDERKKN